ncbi:hypothetical protein CI957_939 [Methanohalophilus sp. WG1-DM]|nr:hypothetical protein CI957_939 [Methanohalophilus sp. WG1-DM]
MMGDEFWRISTAILNWGEFGGIFAVFLNYSSQIIYNIYSFLFFVMFLNVQRWQLLHITVRVDFQLLRFNESFTRAIFFSTFCMVVSFVTLRVAAFSSRKVPRLQD